MLHEMIQRLEGWPFGPVREVCHLPIGESTGFASTIEHVVFECEDGSSGSVVLKTCPGDEWMTEVQALRVLGREMPGSVPRCFGGYGVDDGGVVVLEDLTRLDVRDPADGIDRDAAARVGTFVAHLHGGSWWGGDVATREPTIWAADRWRDRLEVLVCRYPHTQAHVDRLRSWLDVANSAAARIAALPKVRVHGDLHLDNLLWRADGSMVALDWSNAGYGPAVMDLVPVVFPWPTVDVATVVEPYADALAETAVVDARALTDDTYDMVAVMARGTIGFGGRTDVTVDSMPFERGQWAPRSRGSSASTDHHVSRDLRGVMGLRPAFESSTRSPSAGVACGYGTPDRDVARRRGNADARIWDLAAPWPRGGARRRSGARGWVSTRRYSGHVLQ